MCPFSRLRVSLVLLIAVASCTGDLSNLDADELMARARQSWMGGWHAVWQVEWHGAPLSGPLVAEIWHSADGRVRIETLEAPVPALSGLTLVDDGHTRRLYDLRQDRWETEAQGLVRIPLASDALDAIDWLFLHTDDAVLAVAGRDALQSGPAIRLDVVLATGDRTTLWVDEKTGFPSRVELSSATWGQASLATRSISGLEQPHPGLFAFPQRD